MASEFGLISSYFGPIFRLGPFYKLWQVFSSWTNFRIWTSFKYLDWFSNSDWFLILESVRFSITSPISVRVDQIRPSYAIWMADTTFLAISAFLEDFLNSSIHLTQRWLTNSVQNNIRSDSSDSKYNIGSSDSPFTGAKKTLFQFVRESVFYYFSREIKSGPRLKWCHFSINSSSWLDVQI